MIYIQYVLENIYKWYLIETAIFYEDNVLSHSTSKHKKQFDQIFWSKEAKSTNIRPK